MPLRIVRFTSDQANYVEWGDHAFFVYRGRDGKYRLLRAKCPHRGGPLFLGEVTMNGREAIRCPWHDSVIPIKGLAKKAPPMTVRDGLFTLVVNVGEGEVPHIRRVRNFTQPPCETNGVAPNHEGQY